MAFFELVHQKIRRTFFFEQNFDKKMIKPGNFEHGRKKVVKNI